MLPARLKGAEAETAEAGPAALHQRDLPLPPHPDNGGLPHNRLGEVEPAAYQVLLEALSAGDDATFERIPLGGVRPLRNLSLVTEVATRALKAVWYQKWYVHRRLRPEEFGGRVHHQLTGAANYPIDSEILNSQAVRRTFRMYGTYLLPQAYPEGSPLHPAYGAGHATVAGACVTVLKAWFDESFVLPDPVVPSADGTELVPYSGRDADFLTVGSELDKVAANIAFGRNFAGIHWRTDYSESLKLGEDVAIGILRDQKNTYKEGFAGFSLTKFDGETVTV